MGLLDGKVAVITGAARGIGKAIALKFASEGANIAFTDLVVNEAAEATVKEIEAFGVKVKAYASNAANFEQTHTVVDEIHKEFGRIDILVNNAGITKDGLMLRMEEGQWDAVIGVNLKSAFNFIHACTPIMAKQREGSIINMSSVSGIRADYAMCAYNTAKGAITNLTRAMALDYADDNIRVNAVCPGVIRTDIAQHTFDCVPGSEEMFRNAYPVHCIADPVEVANAVVFLASRESDFINGVNLPVDGGITCHTGQPCTGTY